MINKKMLIFLLIIIVVAVMGGVYLYNKGNEAKQDNTRKIILNDGENGQVTNEEAPTDTPSPTPDLKMYSIKVLNGSGVAGKALEIKTFLEEKGFTVSETANADNYDFTKTLIQYQKTVNASFIGGLKTALSERFVLDEPEVLEASDEGDVVVTIGSETP